MGWAHAAGSGRRKGLQYPAAVGRIEPTQVTPQTESIFSQVDQRCPVFGTGSF
jgi:hypothetical protein